MVASNAYSVEISPTNHPDKLWFETTSERLKSEESVFAPRAYLVVLSAIDAAS
jgi:hypothetical protein